MAENIDAERAAFKEWFDETMYRETARDAMEAAWLAARCTSASIGEDGLPELPSDKLATTYTADQMRQYAREAIATDRRARDEAHTAEMAKWARDNGLNVPPQWTKLGASAPQAAQGVKTWQERAQEGRQRAMFVEDERFYMRAEIDDLRAQLACQNQDIDNMAAEMKRLHDALCFWLPQSHAGLPDAMQERIAADAYLLVGYDDMPDPKSAEELGWIVARQSLGNRLLPREVFASDDAYSAYLQEWAAPPLSSEQQPGEGV